MYKENYESIVEIYLPVVVEENILKLLDDLFGSINNLLL